MSDKNLVNHEKGPEGRDEFEIAIICALPLEADAVYYLFDEFFPNKYHKAYGDTNHYTNGRIGKHNVILVILSGMGKVHAAGAAASLKVSYTRLRLALLVGVCGGVPRPGKNVDEIFLGDVIISNALIQIDFGRRYPGGRFVRKSSVHDSLGRPSSFVRSLLRSLETIRFRANLEKRTAELLQLLQAAHVKSTQNPWQRSKYNYPGRFHDVLFESNYRHRHYGYAVACCNETSTCDAALTASCEDCGCERSFTVAREQTNSKDELKKNGNSKYQEPNIQIGPVASGDIVLKSGEDRDTIAKQEQVLAFEMEGAGVWDHLPCIIVKGVCDYADSHKHKNWQNFAAATAAAAMRALLESIVAAESATKPSTAPLAGPTHWQCVSPNSIMYNAGVAHST